MSKVINKMLIAVTIFTIVIFLVMVGLKPVFAAEATEVETTEKTIASGIEWLKSLSVDEIKGWIGTAIAFLATGVGSIILLVIKIAYDSVKKAKMQIELKEVQTDADKKIIALCDNFTKTEEATKDQVIAMMQEFASQYDIKLTTEINNAVESQKKVLDEYADKIKQLEEIEE